jgi:hypothetical protein
LNERVVGNQDNLEVLGLDGLPEGVSFAHITTYPTATPPTPTTFPSPASSSPCRHGELDLTKLRVDEAQHSAVSYMQDGIFSKELHSAGIDIQD